MRPYEDAVGVKTHILGFDNLLNPPSLPKNTTIIVSGPMGCGKTTFIMDYLMKGIIKDGHFSVFVSLEESSEHIIRDYSNFTWGTKDPPVTIRDVLIEKSELENESENARSKLLIIDFVKLRKTKQLGDYMEIDSLSEIMGEDGVIYVSNIMYLEKILELVLDFLRDKLKVEYIRLGFDSLTAYLSALSGDEKGAVSNISILGKFRKKLLDLRNLLENYPVTTLMSSEAFREDQTRFGVEEFISRGVIFMGYQWHGAKRLRYLTIVKMRGREHNMSKFGFEIRPDYGIRLLSEVF